MPDIFKDRNYYRMLPDSALREEAERTQNELALTIIKRQQSDPQYKGQFHGSWIGRP